MLTTEFFLMQGRFSDALEGLAIAVHAAKAQGEVASWGSCLNDLAVVHMLIGNDAEAEQCLLRALELVDAHGIAIGRVTVKLNLARVHLHAGRAAEAAAMCREALPLARELGEPTLCASAEHRLADALVEMGGHEQEALELYREALRRRGETGDATVRLRTHIALGALLVQLGRTAEAAKECRAASALVDESKDLPSVMKLNTVLAQLRHVQGDGRAALHHAHRAVDLANRTQHATGQARALSVLAMILSDHGNRDDARTLWQLLKPVLRAAMSARRTGGGPGSVMSSVQVCLFSASRPKGNAFSEQDATGLVVAHAVRVRQLPDASTGQVGVDKSRWRWRQRDLRRPERDTGGQQDGPYLPIAQGVSLDQALDRLASVIEADEFVAQRAGVVRVVVGAGMFAGTVIVLGHQIIAAPHS
jgi:tetratricopeptide (TPR) repeat protein